jgi:hypothetical protein
VTPLAARAGIAAQVLSTADGAAWVRGFWHSESGTRCNVVEDTVLPNDAAAGIARSCLPAHFAFGFGGGCDALVTPDCAPPPPYSFYPASGGCSEGTSLDFFPATGLASSDNDYAHCVSDAPAPVQLPVVGQAEFGSGRLVAVHAADDAGLAAVQEDIFSYASLSWSSKLVLRFLDSENEQNSRCRAARLRDSVNTFDKLVCVPETALRSHELPPHQGELNMFSDAACQNPLLSSVERCVGQTPPSHFLLTQSNLDAQGIYEQHEMAYRIGPRYEGPLFRHSSYDTCEPVDPGDSPEGWTTLEPAGLPELEERLDLP